MDAEERFWTKVDRSGECWIWMGWQRAGYGRFWHEGRNVSAHRFAYEQVNGPVPEGLSLDHLCRVTRCVRHDHLEAVPQRTNVLRGTGTSAENARKAACKHGHEFTPENTYSWRGFRICRECARLREAKRVRRSRIAEGTP